MTGLPTTPGGFGVIACKTKGQGVTETTLQDRATSINRHLALYSEAEVGANAHRLTAGKELLEARKHVPKGTWKAWCEENIRRTYRDIKKIMAHARSDDPQASLAQERAANREQMSLARAGVTRVTPDTDNSRHPSAEELQKLDAAAVAHFTERLTVGDAAERFSVKENQLKKAIAAIKGSPWHKVLIGELGINDARDASIEARGTRRPDIADGRQRSVGIQRASVTAATPEERKQIVTSLHEESTSFFIYDFAPRFIAWVKSNPSLEPDGVVSLHSAIDGIETMCRKMHEALAGE